MRKQGTPRTTKASNGSAARKRPTSPDPSFNLNEALRAATTSHEDLAARAYAIFLARGGQPGDDLRDWFQAEAELRREQGARRSPSPK
jgi:hypothetical protein